MFSVYYLKNISITSKELNFGRLEVESIILHRNSEKGLVNSPGKRNKL
tara:strand:- start:1504 stop:1647 length:144 start_codon:yes stop_codon:yes gene_type:complete